MALTPQEVIQNLGDLPPLPRIATQVIRISADSDTSTKQLQNLVRLDQALSAQLLRIANSAIFGMVREVTTLTQAVLTLGFSTARSVVLAASVKNLFTRGPVGPKERLLWEHALVTAITGSAYSRAMRIPESEEAFLAGLMHDIGKSVLTIKFPERYGAVLLGLPDESSDGLSRELDAFGFDHTMVGEALLHSWNISDSITAAVRWHHDPMQAPPEHRRLAALVALGNQLALDLAFGLEQPEVLAGATWEALDALHLQDESYQTDRTQALAAFEADRTLLTDF